MLALGLAFSARAQWVAYNDHNRGAGTAPNVSTYSPTALGVAVGGPLTNFLTGQLTGAGVTINSAGSVNSFAIGSLRPDTGTPADRIFGDKVDWTLSSIWFGTPPTPSEVRITFTNLAPGRRYNFRGTAIRGSYYTTRWTLATLAGVSSATAAHLTGTGSPGIITNGWTPYGDTLMPNFQAVWNSGHNLAGDVIGWDRILPSSSSFSVVCSNWTVATPGGAGNTAPCYAFSAVSLAEVQLVYIVTHPQSLTACTANPFSLGVVVAGGGPYGYQWRKGETNLLNATNATFIVASATANDAGDYTVVVTNFLGSVTSSVATVTVADIGITLLAPPQNTTVIWGTPATFSVGINADASSPAFQWYKNFAPENFGGTLMLRATNAQFTIPAAYETNAAYYYVAISNCVNVVTSPVASLSIIYALLAFTTQPQDATVYLGSSVTFTASVSGSAPRYQWFHDGSTLAGATNATLTLTNLQFSDSGFYRVVVNNLTNSVVSRDALLVVNLPPYVLVGLTNHFWRYNQNGVDLGTAWRAVSYTNEASWPTGRGILAWENLASIVPLTNTVLSLTNAAGEVITTYYFRTTFNLTNDLSLITLTTSNLIDDGCVVYVNGVEAYRVNMPNGPIYYNTFTPTAYGEGAWPVTNVPSALLVQGTNTLAVEVHQVSATSADVVFGLAAMVNFITPSFIQITNQPQDLTVEELKPASFSVGYIGMGAKFQWFKWNTNGTALPVPGATRPTLTIAHSVAGVDDGAYFVVLSNVLGVVASSNAFLTVVPDTSAPALLDADGTTNASVVVVSFNEPLFLDTNSPATSPANPGNFTITNTFGESLSILSAVFTNETNVILTTASPRRPDANYLVTVRAVADIAPRHSLATDLAVPVSTLLPLINFVDAYYFSQPLPGVDPTEEFDSGAWRLPEYDPAGSAVGWFYPGWSPFYYPGWHPLASDATIFPPPSGTVLSQGTLATYFRKPFELIASRAGLRVHLRHLVDDGAVFYLNGVEWSRSNMPAGVITISTPAEVQVSAVPLSGPFEVAVTNFLPGPNLLAAELHARVVNELDLFFALELQARVDSLVTGPVVITTSPASVTVREGEPAVFNFRGVAGRAFQWQSNGVALADGTNAFYTLPHVPLTANGSRYRVAVTGVTNSEVSGEAVLTVLPDTRAPALVSAYLTGSNTITVTFSELVSEETAANRLNYAITNAVGAGLSILSVARTTGSNVVLTVGSVPAGAYTVVVSNVRDASVPGNTILANSRVTVGLQNVPVVALDAVTLWRYNQDGLDLGTSWRGLNYDDSGWPLGAALFDGKTGGRNPATLPELVRTILLLTDGTASNIPVYYFRTKFNVPVLGPGATLMVRHVIDDGAAFYLNSNLLYSIGVAVPTIYGAWATRTVGDATNEGPFNVPATNLFLGTNLLAVELKNVNATSADITFGTWLYLNVPSVVLPAGGTTNSPPPIAPRLFIARQDANTVKLWWTNAGPFALQSAELLTPTGAAWTPVPGASSPHLLPATNAAQFYRLKQ